MNDPTEYARRAMVMEINSQVESDDEEEERKRLEKLYKKVWNTKQLSEDFIVRSFKAPFVIVIRKSDGALGSLYFQHIPRFYFHFVPGDQ